MTDPLWRHLCATCLQPIPTGREAIVMVGTGDPENPASVYVHVQHRTGARKYPSDLADIKSTFDEQGHPR
jgi:hypothetical protein